MVDAGALEGGKISDIETAIPGAAGDDDTAGADPLLAGESEQEAPSVSNGLALA